MSFPINEKLRKFFSGNEDAWEEIFRAYYPRMVRILKHRFSNLEASDVADVVSEWFTETYAKLCQARNQAEIEAEEQKLSEREVADQKIELCTKALGFDFERPFETWLGVVLHRKVIDFYWKTKRRNELANSENETFPADGGDQGKSARRMELVVLMKEFKHHLISVLNEKEKLYFQIWLDEGWKPEGKTVRQIFKTHFKQDFTDSAITLIRQNLDRFCYLISLRLERDARDLRERFFDLLRSKKEAKDFSKTEDAFFYNMMRIIWKVFYDDAEIREVSRRKISTDLWEHWETLEEKQNTKKNNLQNKLLKEAFLYFQAKSQNPTFCRVIKMYADDIFGRRAKEFFNGAKGNAGNE
jgi:DNA-directed RNA polymerase specialized sigma24 family protein